MGGEGEGDPCKRQEGEREEGRGEVQGAIDDPHVGMAIVFKNDFQNNRFSF